MTKLRSTATETDHACLHTDSLELSAVEIGGAAGKFLEVYIILIDVHLARVNLHNPGTGLLVREGKLNFAIETTRSQQSRVQDVRSVCGRNDLNAIVLGETIKLV